MPCKVPLRSMSDRDTYMAAFLICDHLLTGGLVVDESHAVSEKCE